MNLRSLLHTILFLHFSTGIASLPTQSPANQSSIRPLHIFSNGTAAENLFVRQDNSVLLTTIYPSALLYYFPSPNRDPILLFNFTASSSDVAAYGITEYSPNLFAVVTGTFDRSGNVTNATGTIWGIDLSVLNLANTTANSSINTTRLATLHNVGFLNGAVTLDPSTLLVADSVKGVVYAVNTQNGNSAVALNDTSLQPNATGPVRLGVNGLKLVDDNTLYFTNTNQRSVGKVDVQVENGTVSPSSPYELVARNVYVDDLEVDDDGNVYLPALTRNEITVVVIGNENGTESDLPQVRVLAGGLNSTDVPGPTALKFAKGGNWGNTTRKERGENGCVSQRLLIATSGGIEYPINGTFYMGGGLYELSLGDGCS